MSEPQLFVGPVLPYLPKITAAVDQISETNVRIQIVIGHVDATLPYPNPEGKVYTEVEIRRLVGTFLEKRRLFSFDDDVLTVCWSKDHSLVIYIAHKIASWNEKLPYYWYHTALEIVDNLADQKIQFFGMVDGEIAGVRQVIGYRFQPCAVENLEEDAKCHLDD